MLVPNPNPKVSGQATGEPYVPLGLLSIATELENNEISVSIVDINRECPSLGAIECTKAILNEKPDIIGFSTQVNEYPRTLQIAELCKQKRPLTPIILGGPQASIVDIATMAVFPFVDIVVRGECEQNITGLIKAIETNQSLDNILGITFRNRGHIIRTSAAHRVDVSSLPIPDYSLVPDIGSFEILPVEVGRGCPFECTFCSTKDFFQRKFRFRKTEQLLQLISHLRNEYDIQRFSFKHDNVTVSKIKMLELCNGIKQLKLDTAWTCSARADCMDEELVKTMADAGCHGIFMGIETGSPKMQQLIRKNLDLDKIIPLADCLRHNGIDFGASFMMGFPEETLADLEKTISLMTSLRYKCGGSGGVQLHMLSPYPGTRIYEENKSNLFFDGSFSDTAVTNLNEDMKSMVLKHPEIFSSFYYPGTKHLDRKFLLKVNFLMMTLMEFFPYTSLIMSQIMAADYPRQLLASITLLNCPNSPWVAISNGVKSKAVYKFLRDFIQRIGDGKLALLEVLEYEKTACDLVNKPKNEEALQVKEFKYDVETWISKVKKGPIPRVSELFKTRGNRVFFIKKDGKVKTVMIPD